MKNFEPRNYNVYFTKDDIVKIEKTYYKDIYKKMSVEKFLKELEKDVNEGRVISFENHGDYLKFAIIDDNSADDITFIIPVDRLTEAEKYVLEELGKKTEEPTYRVKRKEAIYNTKPYRNLKKGIENGNINNLSIDDKHLFYTEQAFLKDKEEQSLIFHFADEREVAEELVALSKKTENRLAFDKKEKFLTKNRIKFLKEFISELINSFKFLKDEFIRFLSFCSYVAFYIVCTVFTDNFFYGLFPFVIPLSISFIKAMKSYIRYKKNQKYHLSVEEYKEIEQAENKYEALKKATAKKEKKETTDERISKDYIYLTYLIEILTKKDKETGHQFLLELKEEFSKYSERLKNCETIKNPKLALYEKASCDIAFLGVLEYMQERIEAKINEVDYQVTIDSMVQSLEERTKAMRKKGEEQITLKLTQQGGN